MMRHSVAVFALWMVAILFACVVVALGTTAFPWAAVRMSPLPSIVYAAAFTQPARFVFPTAGCEADFNAFRRRVENNPSAYAGRIEASAAATTEDDRAAAAVTARLLLAGRDDLPRLAEVLERLKSDPSARVRFWAGAKATDP